MNLEDMEFKKTFCLCENTGWKIYRDSKNYVSVLHRQLAVGRVIHDKLERYFNNWIGHCPGKTFPDRSGATEFVFVSGILMIRPGATEFLLFAHIFLVWSVEADVNNHGVFHMPWKWSKMTLSMTPVK